MAIYARSPDVPVGEHTNVRSTSRARTVAVRPAGESALCERALVRPAERRSDDVRIEQVGDATRVEIAPGFVAIHHSSQLGAALRRMIDLGGTVFGAMLGPVLVGYAAEVPFASAWSGNPGECSSRWQALPDAHEGVVEVARGFRGAGTARRLLRRLTSSPHLDHAILIGEALQWHWDVGERGLSPFEYRGHLLAVLGSAGFRWYETNEPEIAYSEHNFLVARVGPDVSVESRRAFEAALLV